MEYSKDISNLMHTDLLNIKVDKMNQSIFINVIKIL